MHTEQAALQSAERSLQQGQHPQPSGGPHSPKKHLAWRKDCLRGILDIAATNEMFADTEAYETDLDRVRPGQPATITSAVLKEPLQGRVFSIERALERQQVVNMDAAANTDARVALVWMRLDPAAREAANHLILFRFVLRSSHERLDRGAQE